MFTDGCGLMSCTLSQDMKTLCNLPCAPSVVEVKFKGFRGTLVRFNDMANLKVKALFRNSMSDISSRQNVMRSWKTLGIVMFLAAVLTGLFGHTDGDAVNRRQCLS